MFRLKAPKSAGPDSRSHCIKKWVLNLFLSPIDLQLEISLTYIHILQVTTWLIEFLRHIMIISIDLIASKEIS